jgi:hypothetical protein
MATTATAVQNKPNFAPSPTGPCRTNADSTDDSGDSIVSCHLSDADADADSGSEIVCIIKTKAVTADVLQDSDEVSSLTNRYLQPDDCSYCTKGSIGHGRLAKPLQDPKQSQLPRRNGLGGV